MDNLVGQNAPDFSLEDQHEKFHSLGDYRGKWVLLYFYPKDMTSGCTVEAEMFRDEFKVLQDLGVVVLGVSIDDCQSHKKFAEKLGLPFSLLADVDKEVVNKYGVWVEKSMYGKKYMGIARESFLIDPQGKIVKHYQKVKPELHAAEVVEDLRKMR